MKGDFKDYLLISFANKKKFLYNIYMKIGVIGTGYVGLVSSVCLAHSGHSLVCIDKRKDIIDSLAKGIPTIYEQGMDTMLSQCIENNAILFSSDFQSLQECRIIFLAVGTPSLPNGHADLSQVFSAIDSLLPIISEDTMIAIRSTVPVGTVKKVRAYLDAKDLDNKEKHNNTSRHMLGFCPEFLREGVAISDFLNPSYLVFACDKKEGQDILEEAYASIIDSTDNEVKVVKCDTYETAELIKYTINAFLATKITFMNQIAQLAQVVDADIDAVVRTIGADKRIGELFLNPGPGFGGSCFPKDTIALVKCGMTYGVDMSVVEEVNHSNKRHKEYIASWILETLEKNRAGTEAVSGKKIAVWGLTFKADTDDVRDSAAITIIESFFQRNIEVYAYDPKGNENFKAQVNNTQLRLFTDPIEAVRGTDVLVVLTEWELFHTINIQKVYDAMNGETPLVFDTRGILDADAYKAMGFQVYKFGR